MPYKSRRERRYRQKQAKAAVPSPLSKMGWEPGTRIRRSDLRMVTRAIRERWDVPQATRNAVGDRLMEILSEEFNADSRLQLAACRAGVAMVGDDNRRMFRRIYAELGMPIPASLR